MSASFRNLADALSQLPDWVVYPLAGIGALTLAHQSVQVTRTLLPYIYSSKLPRYLHCTDGSWALVTGGSDGIGRAIAEELLARGFNVVLHGRNEGKLERLADTLRASHPSRRVRILVADASTTDLDWEAIRQQMHDLPGKLTVLINNVGGIHSQRIYQTLDASSTKDLVDCINTNATFTTLITSTLLPLLRKNGPSLILNCGSITPAFCPPYLATYVGTKAYLHSWATSLRLEIDAQRLRDKIEVLTVAIGDTTSSTNTYDTTLSAAECAKACLDRVGCGRDIVIPHIKYLLTVLPLEVLPAGIVKPAMISMLKKRFEAEEKTSSSR